VRTSANGAAAAYLGAHSLGVLVRLPGLGGRPDRARKGAGHDPERVASGEDGHRGV
jgi:hypothetical protein